MKVKATYNGQYKGLMYKRGQTFEIDPKDQAWWMQTVAEAPKSAPTPTAKEK